MAASAGVRREGDAIAIPGDYQHRAAIEGSAVQRFWHQAKQMSIAHFLAPSPGMRVIDVGCGSGTISGFLGSYGAQVLGIDGSPDAIAFAARTYGRSNVRFERRLVDEEVGTPASMDVVYCLEVIEHVHAHQGQKMLRAFHRLLKPGGRVFLTTPNYRSVWPAVEWAMDKLRRAPAMRGSQHVEFYHARKLRRLCSDAGFEVTRFWSNCLLAPWLAPLSWRLAEGVNRVEWTLHVPIGAILGCVLTKPLPAEGGAQ